MDIMSNSFLPGDQRLIEQIVSELKSQGIFDQFRKECISDVDTKPAYQNLRQRVESSVSGFLTKQSWNSELNKNQVREMVRKNIYESGFLETGVERIVDQVVNPKITSVFLPKVEDVVYKFLGIEKPVKAEKNIATPLKLNTFHDLLPKDLEAISPEIPEEKEVSVKDEIDDVKMEEDESPSFEALNDGNDKIVPEENSVDSQSSALSGIVSHDSNHSQKQDSLMSLNSSESRMSIVISENTPKIESDDVFLSQKSCDSNSKPELSIVEKPVVESEKPVIESEKPDVKQETEEVSVLPEESVSKTEAKSEKNSENIVSKSRDSRDKKRKRHHSSSDRSKSRSDKDKDRSRSDKHKKEDKESSKEQKSDKEKYRIPKLSDKSKNAKDTKLKDKDDKYKEKSDKDIKTDRDKKSDKDRKSSKHSSERDKAKSDSKSRRDSKSDKKDKEKEDKREKADSSRSEKSKDDKKSSSSSKKRESNSSKDKQREKDKESNSKVIEGTPEKKKNGHSSTSSGSAKSDSKPKKDEEKSKSSSKKDEKTDKDDKKKKRSSKDDHYSSKDKKNGRRSSDRDSDGPSNSKRLPSTPQKNSSSDNYSTQKSKEESSCSNLESSTGDSGSSDKIEDNAEENNGSLLLDMNKFKLPKFASNLQEAMKIMKIRKQLKKLENTNKLNFDNLEVKKILKDIAELSKDTKKVKKEEEKKTTEDDRMEEKSEEKYSKAISIDINDFISSSNISMAKWNALEAKFMEEMGAIDYDSYESPYIDDEESSYVEHAYKVEKPVKKVGETLEKLGHEIIVKDNKETNEEIIEKTEQITAKSKLNITGEIKEEIIENHEQAMGGNNQESIEKNKESDVLEDTVEMNNEEEVLPEIITDALNTSENVDLEVSTVPEVVEISVEKAEELIIQEEVITEEIIDEPMENINEEVEYIDDSQIIREEVISELIEFSSDGVEGSTPCENEVIQNTKLCEESTELPHIVETPFVKESDSCISNSPISCVIEAEKTIAISSQTVNIEDFKRKAVVLLEKHSLTEELIRLKRNGENANEGNLSIGEKEKPTKTFETEKENIEMNGIVIVENSVTEFVLPNETNHTNNSNKNRINNPVTMEKQKQLKNRLVEIIRDDEENFLKNEDQSMPEKKVCHEDNQKTTPQTQVFLNGCDKDVTNVVESSDKGEDVCLYLENSQNERVITVLKCLIESIENDISESKEIIRKFIESKDETNVPKTRKRKLQNEKSDISNNNLEDSASKRLRTKNTKTISKKSLTGSKKKEIEENTEILEENKFSLPLSPAESEPSVERKTDAQIVDTKNRRQSNVRNNVKKIDETAVVTPVQKSKLSNSTPVEKKTRTQRYSSEDLYKPRMFLRRNVKDSKKS